MPLQIVETQRLYRQIADQLRTAIEAGEWDVGARLPGERDLAKQLGVSRPSVREALIALEVEGWVEVRTGSGVFVLEHPAAPVAASAPRTRKAEASAAEWGPLELLRARRVLEGEIAGLAAQLARRKDIDAIARALDSMESDAARGVLPLQGDRDFHSAIVQACGNGVLIDTVQRFWDARRGPMYERMVEHFETPRSWLLAIQEHHHILGAIRAHDSDAARAAMHEHMDRSHARFSASWSRSQGNAGPPLAASTRSRRRAGADRPAAPHPTAARKTQP